MKRTCAVCGQKFTPPRQSRGRTSKRITCSHQCHRKLVTNKILWTPEEKQFLHDYANELPLPLFYEVFKRHATINNWPSRTFSGFCQCLARLGYSAEPKTTMMSCSRLAKIIGISPNTVSNWPDQGLKVRYRMKDGTRYFRISDIYKFAKMRPQNFGGLKYENLYALLGDEKLCRHILLTYPKRHRVIAQPRRVLCVTSNKVYRSLADAAKDTFLDKTTVYKSCKFNQEFAGLRFRYYD